MAPRKFSDFAYIQRVRFISYQSPHFQVQGSFNLIIKAEGSLYAVRNQRIVAF